MAKYEKRKAESRKPQAKSERRTAKSVRSLECIYIPVTPATSQTAQTSPLLVYDGDCGFCARSVQFILTREHRHDLRFVPRDSEFGKELRRRFHLEAVESMLWIENNSAFIESNATLHAAKYVGGIWAALASIATIVPSAVRNWGYRLIARHRKRLSSGLQACLVPTAEQRTRFLG
jgi:predicted DCC family thiol-disulfide oxidoreductase YuxK